MRDRRQYMLGCETQASRHEKTLARRLGRPPLRQTYYKLEIFVRLANTFAYIDDIVVATFKVSQHGKLTPTMFELCLHAAANIRFFST